MERVVLWLCGFWFWVTRRFRAGVYRQGADILSSAQEYLRNDYATWASTRDRGGLLPFHNEALDILEHQQAEAITIADRLESLAECCRFVTEELAPHQAVPAITVASHPAPAPHRSPVLAFKVPLAAIKRMPMRTLQLFWNSERVGAWPVSSDGQSSVETHLPQAS